MQKYETPIEPNGPAPGLGSMDAAGQRFFDANKFNFGTTTVEPRTAHRLNDTTNPACRAVTVGRFETFRNGGGCRASQDVMRGMSGLRG